MPYCHSKHTIKTFGFLFAVNSWELNFLLGLRLANEINLFEFGIYDWQDSTRQDKMYVAVIIKNQFNCKLSFPCSLMYARFVPTEGLERFCKIRTCDWVRWAKMEFKNSSGLQKRLLTKFLHRWTDEILSRSLIITRILSIWKKELQTNLRLWHRMKRKFICLNFYILLLTFLMNVTKFYLF